MFQIFLKLISLTYGLKKKFDLDWFINEEVLNWAAPNSYFLSFLHRQKGPCSTGPGLEWLKATMLAPTCHFICKVVHGIPQNSSDFGKEISLLRTWWTL